MIQVGDMVKLLDGDCSCDLCDTAREDYHEVIQVGEVAIRLNLHYTTTAFPPEWTWDIQGQIKENE